MIYLKNIRDTSDALNDKGYDYYGMDVLKHFFYGSPFVRERENFDKYNDDVRRELEELDPDSVSLFDKNRFHTTGVVMRFKLRGTNGFIIRASLMRRYCYNNMTLYNSSGFDLYTFKDGVYKHLNVIAPVDGKSVFAHPVRVEEDENIAIYFPNYNAVEEFYLGIKGGEIVPADDFSGAAPVLFYGNTITQGASASRSGNSFCNIFSRKTDTEIINFSIPNCCRGILSVADIMGGIPCSGIVVDYSRNSVTAEEIEARLDSFYKRLRQYHPDVPIVFMTVSCYGNIDLDHLDEAIKTVYIANSEDEKLFLLDQKALFKKDEYDLISVDGIHYNDKGMLRVAEGLVGVLGRGK